MTKPVYKYIFNDLMEIIPVTQEGLDILLNKNWKLTKEEALEYYQNNSNNI